MRENRVTDQLWMKPGASFPLVTRRTGKPEFASKSNRCRHLSATAANFFSSRVTFSRRSPGRRVGEKSRRRKTKISFCEETTAKKSSTVTLQLDLCSKFFLYLSSFIFLKKNCCPTLFLRQMFRTIHIKYLLPHRQKLFNVLLMKWKYYNRPSILPFL